MERRVLGTGHTIHDLREMYERKKNVKDGGEGVGGGEG